MRLNKIIFHSLLIVSLLIVNCSFALAKEYDGLWFMAFNQKNPVLKDLRVREAVDQTINKKYILTEIISEEVVPGSYIPPKMIGYDPDLAPREMDVSYAKLLMKGSNYPMNDKRLKTLTLLHTDGLMTVAIANQIQKDLRNIGMKVKLVEIPYSDEDKWIDGLSSGKHDLYLLGYKANIKQLFTEEAAANYDSYTLIEPLFKSDGNANFSRYDNPRVDKLLGQLENINPALKGDRNEKLKEVNDILYEDVPAVLIFYIEKL
ncbi:MAG: ABC transporter substrate-binding protein [Candidatus Margulisiibacteriota bacterium]|nr:ABC transporter substrate-binding protein [Candidatus Margulisiibacteriota bacterium]